jgi:hypothetical protein
MQRGAAPMLFTNHLLHPERMAVDTLAICSPAWEKEIAAKIQEITGRAECQARSINKMKEKALVCQNPGIRVWRVYMLKY